MAEDTPRVRAWRFEPFFVSIVNAIHSNGLAHGKGHIFRTVKNAKTISSKLEPDGDSKTVDMDILLAASYLHDLGRDVNVGKHFGIALDPAQDHAVRSAILAGKFLSTLNGFPPEKIAAVKDAIRAHSFSRGEKPLSMEAKILSDADKLDAMGAQGIIRTIAYSTEHGRSLKDSITHLNEKIMVLHEKLHTPSARDIAKPKQVLLQQFMMDLQW
ncbi:HD domain-containing protein [Candidatus Bathyarchaeota archaeon]|nr:HD domain-containing protein [Candidatus Bathyarchaeota archaeon]